MKPETLKALKGSIRHWKRLAEGKSIRFERPVASQCDLCKLFNNETDLCRGCPVYEKTGKMHCAETPYTRAAFIYNIYSGGEAKDIQEFRVAAKIELEFLQSLLPKKTKKD